MIKWTDKPAPRHANRKPRRTLAELLAKTTPSPRLERTLAGTNTDDLTALAAAVGVLTDHTRGGRA